MTATNLPNRKPHRSGPIRGLGAAAVLASLLGCAPALDRDVSDPGQRVARYLDALVAGNREVGFQFMVVDRDQISFEYAGGSRDATTREPVTPDTTFLSSSSSKVVTAAAVLQLVDRGQLALDDPVGRHVPELPYTERLTVRHLLNHSSGLPNPLPLDWLHTRGEHASYDEAGTLAAVIARYPKLEFEPGEKYAYSNLSYWILGSLIERVSGKSYCEYLRQEVFAPLGICRDELDCDVADWSRHARGHLNRYSLFGVLVPLMASERFWDEGHGKWSRFQHLHMNGPAYGGLVGNHRGYAKFLQDLLRPESRLFSAATRAKFFAAEYDARGGLLPTTLGWHRTELGGTVAFSKPGGGPGFSSNVRLYPELRLATVFLSNQMRAREAEIQEISDTLDQAFVEARESAGP